MIKKSSITTATLASLLCLLMPATSALAADGEVEQMKAQLAGQQRQLEEQRQQIQELRQALAEQRKLIEASLPRAANAAPAVSVAASEALAAVPAHGPAGGLVASAVPMVSGTGLAKPVQTTPKTTEEEKPAPLQLKIGSTYLTPLGFMDFTSVTRTSNTGTGIGTNFGSIPFNNTSFANLSESRLSAQNSRIGLRLDSNVKGAHVLGYLETDFLGFVPGNAAVSSNSDSLRLRVFWASIRKGPLEVQGGESWSLLTPNRKGLSALPSELFFSNVIDVNYQAGLVWSRDPGFRVLYHPSDTVAMGISFENAEQYIGGSAGGGLVTLPSGLAVPYALQLNNGASTLSAPQVHPDIIAKIAFDPKIAGGRALHFEIAGVERTFKVFNPTTAQHHSMIGGAGSANLSFELVKNFRILTNNYWGSAGGRYIFGQAPDVIVKGDGSLSPIHSGSTVSGFEWTHKNTLLYGYYGGIYIQRNVAIDPAKGALVGYGYQGSPGGQNRTIQEASAGFTQTFWKDARYGALALMGQYSYLQRNPWYVATGNPKLAHVNMVFFNLRYTIPPGSRIAPDSLHP